MKKKIITIFVVLVAACSCCICLATPYSQEKYINSNAEALESSNYRDFYCYNQLLPRANVSTIYCDNCVKTYDRIGIGPKYSCLIGITKGGYCKKTNISTTIGSTGTSTNTSTGGSL